MPRGRPRKTDNEPAEVITPTIKEVRELAKRRASAPAGRLLDLLRGEGQGDADGARALRKEIYSALSWIETEPIAALLLERLEREPDDVAASIAYVLWRQDTVMAGLPARIDAARAAGDGTLAGRLLTALVKGDDAGVHRRWVLAHHADLVHSLGLREEL